MRSLNISTLLFSVVGLVLVTLICANASKVREDDLHPVKRNVDSARMTKLLFKREADDDDDKPKPKKSKSKKLKPTNVPKTTKDPFQTTIAPHPTDAPVTTREPTPTLVPTMLPSTTTTSNPEPATGGPKTTAKPSSTTKNPDDPDDEKLIDLFSDQKEEKALVIKAFMALKVWAKWMISHGKTLNKNRARNLVEFVSWFVVPFINKQPSTKPVDFGRVNRDSRRWEFA